MTLCPEMQTETKPLPVRERPATLKQKIMVAPNKPSYWPVIIILAATAGLAALGLFFCWKSPIGEWLHPGSNWFFKRQLVYLVIGVLGGVLAVYLAGWRRCVKAGPWLLAVWLVLFAVALPQSVAGGFSRWIAIGPFKIELWAMFPIVFPLFMSWLCGKIGKRARLVLLGIVIVGGVAASVKIITNENRMARITAFFRDDASVKLTRNEGAVWAQNQLCAAFAEADWLSGKDVCVKYVPQAMTGGAMSTSALVFGKWFPAATCLLICLLGSGFGLVWASSEAEGKRMFVALSGALVLGPAVYSYLCCLMIVPYLNPMLNCAVPLVSYGGTLAAGTLTVIGLVIAQYMDEMSLCQFAPCRKLPTKTVMVEAVGIAIGLILLMLTANRHNLTFSTTRPDENIVPREVWM